MATKIGKPVFKLDARPTGLARVGFKRGAQIKASKKWVGNIVQAEHGVFKIRLMVQPKDPTEGAWKWVTLKHTASSMEDAQDFVRRNWETLLDIYTLHMIDV